MEHGVPNAISFVTEKEQNFESDENIALPRPKKKKKTNLSELTEVFCGLLSLLFKNP